MNATETPTPAIHTNGAHRAQGPADPPPTDTPKLSADDQFLLDTSPTDYGNALAVERLYYGRFATNEAFGLLYFDGKRWRRENADAMLSKAVIETLKRRGKLGFDHDKHELIKKSTPNSANINNAIGRFKMLPDLYVPVERFDAQPHLLNCKNGVINLKTGELLRHDPRHLITQYIHYDYKPNTPQGTWLSFMATVIGDYHDPAVADYVKMLAGYSATGETREQIMIYLLGDKGRNGKGTFVDVIQQLLGNYATGADFATLTRKRDGNDQGFDIAKLRGARWVVTSESGKEDRLNEAKIKELTGQDTITASHKNKDPFSFKPTFKIWALSNHQPRGDVDDNSFWGRIKIVNFPYSYKDKEDTGLRDHLTQRDVLEGVLAWIVEGAIMWYRLGNAGLKAPEQIRKLVQDVRDRQDNVRQWVKEDCVTGDGIGFSSNATLYAEYQRWCRENESDDTKSQDALSKRLSDLDFKRDSKKIDKKVHRGFVGIRPKSPAERGDE